MGHYVMLSVVSECVAVDLGTSQVVVAYVCYDKQKQITPPLLIPNEVSGLSTPAVVSIGLKKREIGEGAVARQKLDPQNTIQFLTRLLETDFISTPANLLCGLQVRENPNNGAIKVALRGTTLEPSWYSVPQVVAMLLGKLFSDMTRIRNVSFQSKSLLLTIAVPSCFSKVQCQSIVDAVSIAGARCKVRLVGSGVALAQAFHVRHPQLTATMGFLDVGSHHVTMCIATHAPPALPTVQRCSTRTDVGAATIDWLLFDEFAVQIKRTHGIVVDPASRAGRRLLHSCERLKAVLSSGVSQAQIDVENVVADQDIHLKLTLSRFEELTLGLISSIETLVQSVSQNCSVDGVELVGGGSRIPAVRAAVGRVFGDNKLRFTLDSCGWCCVTELRRKFC
eukprot:c12672_g1_i4.p1 GENE.c12672_g1_i4~~c12672_g1_i4.p1  ORF type:complete len:394 (-),score=55.23 c12672_g1_i4:422-1603(-)